MIKIIERQPIKISGTTSLQIEFPFNVQVINVIKSSEKYIYHKELKMWEVPLTSLQYLLDNLTYIDDIELRLLPDEKFSSDVKLTIEHKYPPYKHQEEGILFFLKHKSGLLMDEPGVGKTLQGIYLAEELKHQEGLEHCLIICGINTLKANWKKEIAKYSTESCRVLGEKVSRKGRVSYGTVAERAAELMKPLDAFFVILNIEALRNSDIITALKTGPNKFGLAIFDEAHAAKGTQSQQGHNLQKLTNFDRKIAMTGSLIVNKPTDAYAALKWTGIEKSNLSDFKSQYCVYGGFGNHQIVGYKNIDLLKEEIAGCSLRRKKEDIVDNFPKKTVINELVDMNDSHKKFYDAIKDGIKEEADKIDLNPNNILALAIRLKQAAVCPSILTTEKIESSKLNRAEDLIQQICDNGDKVVVMSSFKEPLYILKEKIKQYQPTINTGDFPDSVVSKNIDRFQTDPSNQVFLCSIQKCGTGITLNAAAYMIFLDQAFTAAQNEQAQDRIYRITNTNPVFIYNLICKDTVDEHINEIVEMKRDFSDFIVDNENDRVLIERLRNYISDI